MYRIQDYERIYSNYTDDLALIPVFNDGGETVHALLTNILEEK